MKKLIPHNNLKKMCLFFILLPCFLFTKNYSVHAIQQSTQLAQNTTYQSNPIQNFRSLSLSNIVLSSTPNGQKITTLHPNEMRSSSLFVRATINDSLGCSYILNGGDIHISTYQKNTDNCLLDTCPATNLKNGGCTLKTNTSTPPCQNGEKTIDFSCNITLPYYASPTDIPGQEDRTWSMDIAVEDAYGQRVQEQKNFSISSLKAVTVSGPTEFGPLSLGSISKSTPISIINSGNTPVSLMRIAVSPMKCKIGVIPPTSFFFSFTPNLPLEQMTSVPSDGIVQTAPNLPKPNTLISSTQKIYWTLKVPPKGLSGTCAGKISYIAE